MSDMLIPKRILVIRLDRLGDVILSTPVLQALRQRFPHAFIAMMVRPPCREAVEGNPHLNEVLLYEKEGRHRGIGATIRFARSLRRFEFDTALVLHPSHRSHWIPWLARIPSRIGYDRKSGWLLTHRLPHRKQEGARHEAVYTLELLRPFGIVPGTPRPVVPVAPAADRRVDEWLAAQALRPGDRLVAIHPSASCVSKRWMPERFAQVADRLATEQGVRICLVAGEPDAVFAEAVLRAMRQPAVNAAGRLSVGELAALLRRCRLLISNDSGPVHVAAAVGTPVVDIFGRNQRGLSPQRWGPLGAGHVVLHKEVGCVTCLAHRCDIEFLCLTSLSVEEVYRAAVSVLEQHA
ncbi:MAG: lipopolysaccharide heptosyltransferase II [Candidatus Omnitrophica bacterium]|nr:lipopolysaccharide heptosyltransferase II [Candidatus Omnitrophota bacterium]